MVLSLRRHRTTNPQASQQGVGNEMWRILTPEVVGLQEGTRGCGRFGKGFHLTKKACSVLITKIFPARQACTLSLVEIALRD
jgi:hypothetical protein